MYQVVAGYRAVRAVELLIPRMRREFEMVLPMKWTACNVRKPAGSPHSSSPESSYIAVRME